MLEGTELLMVWSWLAGISSGSMEPMQMTLGVELELTTLITLWGGLVSEVFTLIAVRGFVPEGGVLTIVCVLNPESCVGRLLTMGWEFEWDLVSSYASGAWPGGLGWEDMACALVASCDV